MFGTVARGEPRPSALAGRWYPGTAAALSAEIEGYLARGRSEVTSPPPGLADVAMIMTPHAGIMYSGPTAGVAWSAAPPWAERLVMVGPAHRVGFRGVALGDFASFRIPTAEVAVDRAALAALEARHPDLARFVPGAHDDEHCLEIQLPFAHAVLPGRPIVPLLAGSVSAPELATVVEAVLGPSDLMVISTDLSHFHPYDVARRRDLATLDAIARLDPHGLGGEDACGYRGVGAGGIIARMKGFRAEVLDYSSSGDTGGDSSSVVGYGAVAFGPAAT